MSDVRSGWKLFTLAMAPPRPRDGRAGDRRYASRSRTTDLRWSSEAYENGLGVAIPTGPNVLGYAMDEGTKAA